MQLTINIQDNQLKQEINNYISTQQKEANELIIQALKAFFKTGQKAPLISKEEISKIVENSQRIEGYEPVSKELELEVEAFMVKHDIKVSF